MVFLQADKMGLSACFFSFLNGSNVSGPFILSLNTFVKTLILCFNTSVSKENFNMIKLKNE
ncbi:MAG: hypothetical protein A2549_02890 [Candidatus Staskawiczbacteria bacterium RIFOXYD2_FULL_37_10]|nr:MAG: hypothetical protein A2891_00560 [Candidatus Staskawiczbacteria bacterium RIFCSPLOWO2_01_FULL_37_19]OGZ77504.1 MAG: hypothetical protein A2280_03480 [Candidatus Staskawiczbacteria bacterium RIFOXYA12_FULL_37_10]OGZ92688.1 MAG: hypothetical protein A2549_02890 [Candidatus Staskawiczbacteria bacterium RIFOXYD2_FULL_37_10]